MMHICESTVLNRSLGGVPEKEHKSILSFCYGQACGGPFGAKKTTEKVLQCGFIGPPSLKAPTSYANAALAINMWVGSQKGT